MLFNGIHKPFKLLKINLIIICLVLVFYMKILFIYQSVLSMELTLKKVTKNNLYPIKLFINNH